MKIWHGFAVAVLWAQGGMAQDIIAVTILPDPGFADEAVSWSAVPVEGTTTAIEAIAMPDSITGPWQTEMEPGEWMVDGYSATYHLSATITVAAGGAAEFVIPALQGRAPVSAPYVCDVAPSCQFEDRDTGLMFALPNGWAADAPYFTDLGDGMMAEDPTVVFYDATAAEGGPAWWLNPLDWVEETGPCQRVAVGSICTVFEDAATKAAFDIIAPSLARYEP